MKYAGTARMAGMACLSLAAGSTMALTLVAAPTWASPTTTEDGGGQQEPASIMLVLDASGSMTAGDAGGGTRMEAARTALTDAVDKLPAEADVGLRVYGATESNKKKTKAACTDTQVVVPLGPVDPGALKDAVADVEPSGFTPTSHALTEAAEDLSDAKNRHIILVSDGEETCDPDPCETVDELTAGGIDVQIDTVGYGVNETARGELRCIAETTGGTYLAAPDADSLGVALDKLSTRALRGFSIQGTPVEGVSRSRTAEAPELVPGQYTDTVKNGAKNSKYYTITGYDPKQRMQIALTARPPDTGNFLGKEQFTFEVYDQDGDTCAYGNDFRLADSGLHGVVVPSTYIDSECVESGGDLLLQVERDGDGDKPAPFELVVRQTGIAVNAESLPAGLEEEISVPDELASKENKAEPVLGGGGFSTATELEPGTYVEQLIPGEEVFYKLNVGWGQSAQFVVDGPTDESFLSEEASDFLRITPHIYTPGRNLVHNPNGSPSADYDLGSPPQRFSLPVPEVRYRNAADSYTSEARYVFEAGDFYLSLAIPPEYQGDAEGRPVPVEFTVDVQGEVSGVPTFPGSSTAPATESTPSPDTTTEAAPSPDANATEASSIEQSADNEGDGAMVWWIAGGVLALLVAFGGGLWFATKRNRA